MRLQEVAASSYAAVEGRCPYCSKQGTLQLAQGTCEVRCPQCKQAWALEEFLSVAEAVMPDDKRAMEPRLLNSAKAMGWTTR